MLRVGIIGYGYWGINLVRNLVHCPSTQPVGICDHDAKRLARARQIFPFIPTFSDLEAMLAAGVDAVLIATPASTHYPLALRILEAGKHLLIEKPITQTSAQARDLILRADRAGRVLMVDHTFIYSAAVRRIKEMIDADELGEIFYIDSVRINLGLVQPDINVFWDLAPHDFSIIDYVIGKRPVQVAAMGKAHVNQQEDMGLATLNFGGSLLAGVHVNWLSPVKIRQMVIGGARKSLVLNDLDPTEKIRVYDRAVRRLSDPEDKHRLLIDYRLGDMWAPHLGTEEPLQTLIQHFADCCLQGQRPLTDGQAGLRIVEWLEATDRSLALSGAPVDLADQENGSVRRAA